MKNRKRDWLPETMFVGLVFGGSLVYVVIRFWPARFFFNSTS